MRLAVGLTTIGRPCVQDLLDSVAASSRPAAVVAVADQSAAGMAPLSDDHPFDLRVERSTGGASAGRNACLRMVGDDADVVTFPNDHSTYPPETLERVAEAFAADDALAALALPLIEGGRPRWSDPGTPVLDWKTVWKAIEPATFFRVSAVRGIGGWDETMGPGAASPYQAGEGSELLVRMQRAGMKIGWRSDVGVVGQGENRDLPVPELLRKHRAYARGTGHVYRRYGYPLRWKVRHVVAPLLKALAHDPRRSVSVRLGLARSLGRVEGLTGVMLPSGAPGSWIAREQERMSRGSASTKGPGT